MELSIVFTKNYFVKLLLHEEVIKEYVASCVGKVIEMYEHLNKNRMSFSQVCINFVVFFSLKMCMFV